ncbi:TetR/AcrR family transcriptional regulator [Porcipelethomonas sp.]|uniref:TetR/AcrR family transcriptional regulator n=1 Tax=Porcipelethomonas sp. TaxID=2981675 RepID=UPI003EFAEFE1
MGKLDTNKKKKRESLLNTAFFLFTTKGVIQTSISEIAEKAGVAKGTFYLYFKDKIDIKNKLIAYKSAQLFEAAFKEMKKHPGLIFEDKIIFIVDNIINQLDKDKPLLTFISKNLSWGIFKHALTSSDNNESINFKIIYDMVMNDSPKVLKEPEIMLFMIVELVGSTIYSSILYNEPVELDILKPYLYNNIKMIIKQHETDIDNIKSH